MKTTNLLSLLIIALLFACKDDEQATTSLELTFEHKAGEEVFEYEHLYETEAGNEFSLRLWRTYISKVRLIKKDGAIYEIPDSYYLIEPLNEGRFSLELENIPVGEYEKISFYIGVAGEANLSEEIVGDLDPSNNMAWNWTTGYKYVRMDGEFIDIVGNRRGVVVHIGTANNLKNLVFNLSPLSLGEERAHLNFVVDLLEAFKNPHTIDFEVENDFQFNNEADLIGENYSNGYIYLKEETAQH
ncbi:hypothetical protein JKA74_02710 [Marivirga sp. S37H4]|uniref:Copper-binding protein MbnP-like domain-containing protein n=1 Tax=Marivirga aurantiaca TaxID=2802615 RepID=A0A935C5L9_9BACT|nr:MbnP family protein [Marivirga aurantiaca]MBK6263936.1 hypothetical protein [Marivirga aurantiaca]